jgi:hypothetical protein
VGCDSVIASVHLIVNSTVAHQNFEGALIAQYVAARVNAEPVVASVFKSLSNELQYVANSVAIHTFSFV